jgi:hypothetical protein
MAINELSADLNIIAALSDEPNDSDGMTAAALKAKYDEAGLSIQAYLNGTLLPKVDVDSAAAKTIPADTDYVGLIDSAASQALKKVSWSNIKAALLRNENLLINWDFRNPVNQRGQPSYTATGYTIDRWKLINDSGTMTAGVSSGYITLQKTSSGATFFVYMFDPAQIPYLRGKTVTYSVLYDSGTIVSKTVAIPASGAIDTDELDIGNSFYVDLMGDASNTYLWLRIYNLTTTDSVSRSAIKLEFGSVSTLANDAPADYGGELRKCRYCFRKVGTGLTAIACSTTEVYIWGSFGDKMRTSPTVTLNTTDIFLHGMELNADKTSSVSSILNVGTYDAGIKYLKINGFTGLTAGAVYGVAADYINADANL